MDSELELDDMSKYDVVPGDRACSTILGRHGNDWGEVISGRANTYWGTGCVSIKSDKTGIVYSAPGMYLRKQFY